MQSLLGGMDADLLIKTLLTPFRAAAYGLVGLEMVRESESSPGGGGGGGGGGFFSIKKLAAKGDKSMDYQQKLLRNKRVYRTIKY